MITTLTRDRVIKIHSMRLADQVSGSKTPRSGVTLSRLVDELVLAFFTAMAVLWVVTAIAGAAR